MGANSNTNNKKIEKVLKKNVSCVKYHVLCVTCRMSPVTCHLSTVINANSQKNRPSPCSLPNYAHQAGLQKKNFCLRELTSKLKDHPNHPKRIFLFFYFQQYQPYALSPEVYSPPGTGFSRRGRRHGHFNLQTELAQGPIQQRYNTFSFTFQLCKEHHQPTISCGSVKPLWAVVRLDIRPYTSLGTGHIAGHSISLVGKEEETS